ncbi:hypothetical protein FGB62_169g00 [Gracilaria domingensis]|nr:hypothetical protein FGB62_169g00 [Gracilaria domingensis]
MGGCLSKSANAYMKHRSQKKKKNPNLFSGFRYLHRAFGGEEEGGAGLAEAAGAFGEAGGFEEAAGAFGEAGGFEAVGGMAEAAGGFGDAALSEAVGCLGQAAGVDIGCFGDAVGCLGEAAGVDIGCLDCGCFGGEQE